MMHGQKNIKLPFLHTSSGTNMKNFRHTLTVTNLTSPHCNVGLLLQINSTKETNAVSMLLYATRHDKGGGRGISSSILILGTWSDWSTSRPGRINPGNTPSVLIEEKDGYAPELIWTQRKCVLVGNAT